jgi:hypothetical protein
MSYLIPPSAGRVTDSRFPHSTFLEYSNSPSVAAYYDEVQRRNDYSHYMACNAADERLQSSGVTDYNSSSFAIHQLLGLAARSTVNGDFETVMTPYADRRRHQPAMASYIVDDAVITSDSACSYSNTTPSPVAMHELSTRKDDCNKLRRRSTALDCCTDMVQRNVTSRDYQQPGNCSYIAPNDRIRQYDDVSTISYDEVRRRHHNYLTSIGL